jgi:hypothetical protein
MSKKSGVQSREAWTGSLARDASAFYPRFGGVFYVGGKLVGNLDFDK